MRSLSRPSELRRIRRAERTQTKQVTGNKHKCVRKRCDLQAHQARMLSWNRSLRQAICSSKGQRHS